MKYSPLFFYREVIFTKTGTATQKEKGVNGPPTNYGLELDRLSKECW
jgi:hypothetical protein